MMRSADAHARRCRAAAAGVALGSALGSRPLSARTLLQSLLSPRLQAATAAYLGVRFPTAHSSNIALLPLLLIGIVPLFAFVQYICTKIADREEHEKSLAPTKFSVSAAVMGEGAAEQAKKPSAEEPSPPPPAPEKSRHLSSLNRVQSNAHWGPLAFLKRSSWPNHKNGAQQSASPPPSPPREV